MYTPKHFEETRIEVLHDLMRKRPLAAVIVLGSAGLNANHLPLLLDPAPAPLGTLRGHVSRGNALWRDFDPSVEALSIFSGPQTYVSPSWYPAKAVSGEVVPTWNYVVAHAYGRLRVVEDPEWLRAHVEALSLEHEHARPEPWRVSDAPEAFVRRLIGGIVGIEIAITKIEGKWKASQNQPPGNRDGVREGLASEPGDEAAAMRLLVSERGRS